MTREPAAPPDSDITNPPRSPELAQLVPSTSTASIASGYQQEAPGYAHVSTEEDLETPSDESNSFYGQEKFPPAPVGYHNRGQPMRITDCARLVGVLAAVGLACFSIAAVIDVSTPPGGFEPGRDERSVADGVLAAMDRSADPCDNFYEYACGTWLRSSKIPPDRTHYSKSFSVVYDMIRLMLRALLEGELQKSPSKAGVFYASCLDQMGSGGLNVRVLMPFRDIFSELHDARSFSRALAELHLSDSAGMFDMDIGIDERKPTQYALYIGQGGLGLPHRDNYFSMAQSDVDVRKKFLVLIEAMLSAAGKARLIPRRGHELLAQHILNFETELANATLPPEELRDPEKSYNKMSIDKLPKGLQFDEYLAAASIDADKIEGNIVLDNLAYFEKLSSMMSRVNGDIAYRRTARGYLAFHLVRAYASRGLLGEAPFHSNFVFKRAVYGIKQLPEKWKTCQRMTGKMLGEDLGAAFVKKHFTKERRDVARQLAREITQSFAESLETQDWMDKETRAAAKDKLSAINWKIGYSSDLDKYEDVTVSHDSYADNVRSCIDHIWKKKLNHLAQPIDHSEWFMKPYETNAYYSATRNEMVFPAGILQPPFFSDAFPEAMNYGSIGAVIGHEQSHGFDDQGRKYDKTGLLTSWWSAASAKRYTDKTKCYIDLFDTYKPRELDLHVRGNLTLGENLADTNGVKVAYSAFKRASNVTEEGAPPPNAMLARELTNDQLFFVAYAQTYCTLYRPESLKVQIMTDPHSPGQFRVRGPLSQNPDFAEAFSCRNGSRYNPAEKCSLW